MSSASKKCIFMGIFFSVFAVSFAILHYFNIIRDMDLMLAVIYVAYFAGVALLYNGAYIRERSNSKATLFCFLIGTLFVLASTALLIYGIIAGRIFLFNFNF